MRRGRKEELELFRKVNGVNSTWNKEGRYSYTNSNSPKHLRQNQGFAKAKFIKYLIKEGRLDVSKI